LRIRSTAKSAWLLTSPGRYLKYRGLGIFICYYGERFGAILYNFNYYAVRPAGGYVSDSVLFGVVDIVELIWCTLISALQAKGRANEVRRLNIFSDRKNHIHLGLAICKL